MRAIAGIYGKSDSDTEQLLKEMLKRMSHRGKSQTVVRGDNFVLGALGEADCWQDSQNQNRAVIRDGQSLADENREQLFSRLVNTTSETAARDIIQKLRPPCCLAAANETGLMLSRDQLGLSFLNYLISEDIIYFATEMKALRAVDNREPINPEDKIRKLASGSILSSSTGEILKFEDEFLPTKSVKIDSSREEPYSEREIEEFCGQLEKLLRSAVAEKIEPDRRTCLLLSGGLDSSIIAALAAEESEKKLPSFSVGVAGSPDLGNARRVAEYLGTDHQEYIYGEEEMLEVLPEVIYYQETFDAPLIRSSVPNYLLSRFVAREGCEILLSGEGSDELFAGYDYLKEREMNEINTELQKLVEALGQVGLQRADRMNGAHGLDCRLPFLTPEMVEFALTIPPELKLKWDNSHKEEHPVEKWILRRAFSDYLPEEIVWRDKQMFGEGSGSIDLCQALNRRGEIEVYGETIKLSDDLCGEGVYGEEIRQQFLEEEGVLVRSQEEYFYYLIFKRFYPEPTRLPDLSRWKKSYQEE